MTLERSRRLINGVWQYVTAPDGGGGPGSTPNLATVLAEGADAGGAGITGLDDPTADQDAATKKYVDDNGGSSSVTETDLSPLAADWTEDGAGTWTYVGGVLSQTDDTADSWNAYNTPLPTIEAIVQCDVRFPSGEDAGTKALAIFEWAEKNVVDAPPAPGYLSLVGIGLQIYADAPGDGANFHTYPFIDGNGYSNYGFPTVVTQDQWHTIRCASNGRLHVVYIDGSYVVGDNESTGSNTATPGPPQDAPVNLAIAAVGLVDFRNLKI